MNILEECFDKMMKELNRSETKEIVYYFYDKEWYLERRPDKIIRASLRFDGNLVDMRIYCKRIRQAKELECVEKIAWGDGEQFEIYLPDLMYDSDLDILKDYFQSCECCDLKNDKDKDLTDALYLNKLYDMFDLLKNRLK